MMIKFFRYALLVLFALNTPVFSQTEGMFNHKKERRHLWRHWNKKRDAYNPYLTKKNKNKPSVQASRSNKRDERRQRRQYKKQIKQAKKNAH